MILDREEEAKKDFERGQAGYGGQDQYYGNPGGGYDMNE
jgi:hypothetical protein